MTGVAPADELLVRVSAADEQIRSRVLALLGRTAMVVARPSTPGPVVVLAAAATIDEALAGCAPAERPDVRGLVLAADTFPAGAVIRAVAAGAHVMVRLGQATPGQLADAVLAAVRGDGRLPAEAMAQLVARPARPARPAPAARWPDGPAGAAAVPAAVPAALTARQAAVLALMADGLGNAAIARELGCSEHTIKNVIYDLTARLQVRNRAQAVACAIRAGII
jgi:DNA-binding NarL/FixJ family response regulator